MSMQPKRLSVSPPSGAIRLAHAVDGGAPHHTALAVMDALAALPPLPKGNLASLRTWHTRSRRPFLAPLEKVHSTFDIFGADGVARLNVIRPLAYETQKNLPVMIYLHGGGWTLGSFETYEPFCRALANSTARIMLWVCYRLAAEHPFPAAFDDARAALRWVHDNALRLGADENRIMI